MNYEEVEQKVFNIVCKCIVEDDYGEAPSFSKDLNLADAGCDSLLMSLVYVDIEDEFQISISASDEDGIFTLTDLVKLVVGKIQ